MIKSEIVETKYRFSVTIVRRLKIVSELYVIKDVIFNYLIVIPRPLCSPHVLFNTNDAKFFGLVVP